MKKIIAGCLLGVVLLLSLLNSEHFRKMQSTSLAKEYCSCHFLTGQSAEYCLEMATHFLHSLRLLPLDIAVDKERRTVRASIGSVGNTFGLVTSRLGCKYFPPKPNP